MSIPISAMITRAAVVPTPGISSRRSTAEAKGAIISAIAASSSAMSASSASTRASILVSSRAWWPVKCPVNASSTTLILARIRPRASAASALGLV
jgi:hypothetical protein